MGGLVFWVGQIGALLAFLACCAWVIYQALGSIITDFRRAGYNFAQREAELRATNRECKHAIEDLHRVKKNTDLLVMQVNYLLDKHGIDRIERY